MKIALIGYGKMGRMIEQIALERGHEIVSSIDVDNIEDFETNKVGRISFTNMQVSLVCLLAVI